MSNWKRVRLGDVLNFRRGHDLPKYDMKNGVVPVAGSNGIIGFHDVATNIAPCITIGRSGNIGTPYIYDKCWAHNTTLYIDDFKGNDPVFLFYFINNLNLSSYGGGSAVPTLNRNHIHPIEVFFTNNLAEQRRIAGVLSSLDDKIEVNNRINANLEAQAQALFKQWFVDFDFPDANGNPYRTSGGTMTDSPLGPIPHNWSIGSVYDIADVIYGAPYKSKLFNDKGEGMPLIRIRDLKTNSPAFFTEEVLPNTEYIGKGDVVAGMDAEFIPYIWQGNTGVLNQRVCKFRPIKSACRYFVYNAIKPHLEFIQYHKVGTTVSHMGKSDIDRIELILPIDSIQEDYARKIDPILEKRLVLSAENQRLAQLRDTLLPKLMNNEIKL